LGGAGSGAHSAPQPDQKPVTPAESMAKAEKAFISASSGLRSGKGEGIFEAFEQHPGGDFILKSQAAVVVAFDQNKYYVKMDFTKGPKHLARRIIVHDGAAVMHSDLWKGIEHPTGAEGYIHSRGDDISRPSEAEFPWDMSQLPRQVFDASGFLKN